MRITAGIWILVLFLPVLNGCSENRINIDVWYGDSQAFGSPGNPQRAINILGNIQSSQPIIRLEYSLNGMDYHPLAIGADGRRLARDGDFNVEIYRHLLQEGRNDLLLRAVDSDGNKTEKIINILYTGKETWPLPYFIDWQHIKASGNANGIPQDRLYLMDGKWRIENGRIRTVEPYYDRVLAFGDSTWENYEVRTDVIFYGHSNPEPGPPTFNVAHAAIAFRWPGHDIDTNQPHVKWYPLGATCEFKISAARDSCRWRMLYGQRPKTENTEWNRHIELGKLYKMAARVETINVTTSRYLAKLWDADLPEPVQWDLVGIKENETMFSGSALLLSHNTDVSFGNVSITKIPSEGPQPGDIYREYAINLKNGNWWRVTDPDAGDSGAAAFLPNPVLEINIDDLEGAVRAEVLMDIWGGHAGTSGKKFRFNDKAWMDVPKVPTIPQRPECYMTEYNVILDLPLRYLKEGINTFEGTSGGQTCYNFNWGQWGWYVMMVRIYYGPGKSHAVGQITWPASGGTISENPEIVINPEDPGIVSKIQVIGKYFGYDENGDGLYFDWHRAYHGTEIEGHIGTITQAPYHLTWDTRFVPDQDPAGISLVARIRDTSGIWFVTDVVNSNHLERPDSLSVKMYTSYDIPEKFTVRVGKTLSCKNDIETLENAISCRMYHRTWNSGDDHAAGGHVDKPLIINGHNFKCYGKNHFFALSSVEIPVSNLYEGINEIAYTSDTEHHGIEILWPGPAFIVRYTPLTLSPPGN